MNSDYNYSAIEPKIKELAKQIWDIAEESQENLFAILLILRELETLHRNIRQEMFEPVLPDTRHRLYLLLRHLEEVGGWPYIERMRLKDICAKLILSENNSAQTTEDS